MVTGLGLMIASAVLVHLSGGVTEMHFTSSVMVASSAFQDCSRFLVSIVFVALHQRVIGVLHGPRRFRHPTA